MVFPQLGRRPLAANPLKADPFVSWVGSQFVLKALMGGEGKHYEGQDVYSGERVDGDRG